jgi:hypothetical protein
MVSAPDFDREKLDVYQLELKLRHSSTTTNRKNRSTSEREAKDLREASTCSINSRRSDISFADLPNREVVNPGKRLSHCPKSEIAVLCTSLVNPSPSETSGTFSVPFVPLDIGQKAGKQAKQGEKSADVEYEFDARMVSKPAKDR